MPHMPDFDAWAIFAKLIECGSFRAAAEELDLDAVKLSRTIARLEERMGATLLHRTRPLAPTEFGILALKRAAQILADGAAIENEFLDPHGRVRLVCSTAFGVHQLAPLLPAFVKSHPLIEIDFELTDRRVDLAAEGFDFALRVGPEPDTSLRIRRLFRVCTLVVASPAFLEEHGRPKHPNDLVRFRALGLDEVGTEAWYFRSDTDDEFGVDPGELVRMRNGAVAVPMAVAGLGIAVLPEPYVADELRAGRLVRVLQDWQARAASVHLATIADQALPARVTAFIDFLLLHFAGQPWVLSDNSVRYLGS